MVGLTLGLGLGCKAEQPAAETPTAGAAEPAAPGSAPGPSPASDTGAAAGAGAAPAAPDGIAGAEPAPDEPPAPAEPLPIQKVLILGDSLAATGFGVLLERKLDADPRVHCFRRGKSASGLARPDFFDWMDESKRHVEWRDPDLVVVILGGNDGQDLVPAKRGKRVLWEADGWPAAYRERLDAFLAGVGAPKRKVLWLGLPPMGLRSLERKLTLIRGVQREAVEALGESARYMDTAPLFTDEQGALIERAHVEGRPRSEVIRADDGIHLTMEGGQYFADAVFPVVMELLGLPKKPPAPVEPAPAADR